jgi:hypothetical protein
MNRYKALLFVLLLASITFSSCSGPQGGVVCPGGVCNPGNANVSLTLFDAPPANADIVNFNVPVIGVTLTPQTGAAVLLLNTQTTFEISRLSSDSTDIGTFSVPSGTYTSIDVTMGSPFGVFLNSSNAAIGNCNALSVCHLSSGAPGTVSVNFSPALTISNNQNLGIGLEFDVNNAITMQNGITIDLKQPNVLKVVTLPRTGQASNTIDTVEDFTGIVTAVSGTQVTIKSDSRGTLVGNTTATTSYDDPQNLCAAFTNKAQCIAINKTISVDATVGTNGTLTITEVDFIDAPSVDEVEGTIFLTPTQGTYIMVVADKTLVSGNAILQPVSSATTINVTLDLNVTFVVDTKNLPVSNPAGFSSSTDIISGQTVMAHVKSVTSGTSINVVADRLLLRFSHLSGTVGTVSGNAFTIQSLPSYLVFSVAPQVQTYIPQTTFDNVTGGAIGGLTTGDPVSIRALFLDPSKVTQPFLAAKVRKH